MCISKAKKVIHALLYPEETVERISPRDIIRRNNIEFYEGNGTVVISGLPPGVEIPDIADTNSMDPVMDMEHNSILVKLPQPNPPFRYEDLAVGDVVVFKIDSTLTCHRIIKIESDIYGRRYTTRGDNTSRNDPYILRNPHIKFLQIGVIY